MEVNRRLITYTLIYGPKLAIYQAIIRAKFACLRPGGSLETRGCYSTSVHTAICRTMCAAQSVSHNH